MAWPQNVICSKNVFMSNGAIGQQVSVCSVKKIHSARSTYDFLKITGNFSIRVLFCFYLHLL